MSHYYLCSMSKTIMKKSYFVYFIADYFPTLNKKDPVAWQDSSLWIPSISTCVSPIFIKNMKKYLKVNLCSFLSILLLLPVTTTIICIHYWGLQFHNWESFVENLMFFQMILYILYPYVVKLKLDKFIE